MKEKAYIMTRERKVGITEYLSDEEWSLDKKMATKHFFPKEETIKTCNRVKGDNVIEIQVDSIYMDFHN